MPNFLLLLRKDQWVIKNYFRHFKHNPKRLIPFSLYFVWILVIFGINRLDITKTGSRPEAINAVGVYSIILLSLYFLMSLYNITQEKTNHFSMGDVNLLFTSPTNPRVILIYTVLKKAMLQVLMAFLTLLLLLPNILSSGADPHTLWLGMFGYFSFVICIEPICFVLLQLGNKSSLTAWVYGTIFLFISSILSLVLSNDNGIWAGLNSTDLYLLPLVGWSRGIYMSMYTGLTPQTLLFITWQVALFLSLIGLVYFLGEDYYEDVLSASEHVAHLKHEMKTRKKAKRFEFHFVKRKKVSIKETGKGIHAFFWKDKVIRNRTDFHHSFTVSTLVLFVAGTLTGFFHNRLTLSIPMVYAANGLLVYALLLGSISGALEMEIDKHYFYVIPGNAFKKLIAVNRLSLRKMFINSLVFNGMIWLFKGASLSNAILMTLFINASFWLIKVSSYLVRMLFRNPQDFTLMLPLMKMIQIFFVTVPIVIAGLLGIMLYKSLVMGIFGMILSNVVLTMVLLLICERLSHRLELI